VHELIHTGMPYLMGHASWFMEGAATYVEPILRARAGWKTEAEVWREWIQQMPQGVSVFASGLSTASGRQNYWGGAIFMLLADLGLRRATAGAMGLEDCLKGALASGLDGPARTRLDAYAAVCDRATGTKVVSGLIEKHFSRAEPVDLDALWKDLGVGLEGGKIVFNDAAPLAQWRRMIVTGPPGRPPKFIPRPWEG
jgi:predicted metalloprotease with PDZ domain